MRDESARVTGLAPFPMATGPGIYRPDVEATAPGSDAVQSYAEVQANDVPAPDAGARQDCGPLIGPAGAPGARPRTDPSTRPGDDAGGWHRAG